MSIGNLTVVLGLDFAPFIAGLKDAEREANAAEKAWKPLITATKELGEMMSVVGDVVVAGMVEMTVKSAEYGAELQHLHDKSGVSIEDLSALGFAATQNGSSLDGLGNSLKFLSKNMEIATTSGGAQLKAFEALGISEKDLTNTHGSASAAFLLLSDHVTTAAFASAHAADMTKVLGKSWTEMVPVLELGRGGIQAFADEAARLGIVLNSETSEADLKFVQGMKEMKDALLGLSVAVGDALIPVLKPLIDDITNGVIAAKDFAKAHKDLTVAIFDTAAVIGGAGGVLLGLTGLALAAPLVAGGFELVTGAAGALNLVLDANPIGLVVVGVAALAAGIVYFHKEIFDAVPQVGELWGQVKSLGAGLYSLGAVIAADLAPYLKIFGEYLLNDIKNGLTVAGLLIGTTASLVSTLVLKFADMAAGAGAIANAVGMTGVGGALIDASNSIYTASASFDDLSAKAMVSTHTMFAHSAAADKVKDSVDGVGMSVDQVKAIEEKYTNALAALYNEQVNRALDKVVKQNAIDAKYTQALADQYNAQVNLELKKAQDSNAIQLASLADDTAFFNKMSSLGGQFAVQSRTDLIALENERWALMNSSHAATEAEALEHAKRLRDIEIKTSDDVLNEDAALNDARKLLKSVDAANQDAAYKDGSVKAAAAAKDILATARATAKEQGQIGRDVQHEWETAMDGMGKSTAKALADMVVTWQFNAGAMINIAENTSKSMLGAFIQGMITPLTNKLAELGTGITDSILGITQKKDPVTGAVIGSFENGGGLIGTAKDIGGLLGIGGNAGKDAIAAEQGANQIANSAFQVAGAAGTAVMPIGTTSLLGIGSSTSILDPALAQIGGFFGGGVAAGAATLGIGAAVAGAIAWLKSQAHWEANTFVKDFQNPFIDHVAAILDPFDRAFATGTATADDANLAGSGIAQIWADMQQQMNAWGAGGGDKGKVVSQAHATLDNFMNFSVLGKLRGEVGALGGIPGFKDGLDYVPYDNFPALLHQGERVQTKAQVERGDSNQNNVTIEFNVNISGGGGNDRSRIISDFKDWYNNNTDSLQETITRGVRNAMPGLAT